MVQNTVHATYTETYDLNTALNELSLMAIHTPQATALKSMFKGFFENYKKYKIVGCNIGMVCASQQSLTPSEIGLEAGQVDPRDILNPILFKACTGENLNEILNQIYGADYTSSGDTSSIGQHIDGHSAASNMYYQLLADDSWRKEHPQRGLFVQGLKPLVHKVVTTQPFRWTGSYSDSEQIDYPTISGTLPGQSGTNNASGFGAPSGQPVEGITRDYAPNITRNTVFISDGTTDMPWLDTTFSGSVPTSSDTSVSVRSQNLIVSVPRVFCGCIVLPPAILQRLFFRLQISWHIMFKDFRPAFEIGPISQSGGNVLDPASGQFFSGSALGTPVQYVPTYWNIYHDGSTKLEKEFSSFDVNGEAEVSQVMENVQ